MFILSDLMVVIIGNSFFVMFILSDLMVVIIRNSFFVMFILSDLMVVLIGNSFFVMFILSDLMVVLIRNSFFVMFILSDLMVVLIRNSFFVMFILSDLMVVLIGNSFFVMFILSDLMVVLIRNSLFVMFILSDLMVVIIGNSFFVMFILSDLMVVLIRNSFFVMFILSDLMVVLIRNSFFVMFILSDLMVVLIRNSFFVILMVVLIRNSFFVMFILPDLMVVLIVEINRKGYPYAEDSLKSNLTTYQKLTRFTTELIFKNHSSASIFTTVHLLFLPFIVQVLWCILGKHACHKLNTQSYIIKECGCFDKKYQEIYTKANITDVKPCRRPLDKFCQIKAMKKAVKDGKSLTCENPCSKQIHINIYSTYVDKRLTWRTDQRLIINVWTKNLLNDSDVHSNETFYSYMNLCLSIDINYMEETYVRQLSSRQWPTSDFSYYLLEVVFFSKLNFCQIVYFNPFRRYFVLFLRYYLIKVYYSNHFSSYFFVFVFLTFLIRIIPVVPKSNTIAIKLNTIALKLNTKALNCLIYKIFTVNKLGVQNRIEMTVYRMLSETYWHFESFRATTMISSTKLSSTSSHDCEDDSAQFASDVGGALGLWIGLSVLSIFEVFQLFGEICSFGVHKLRRSEPTEDETPNTSYNTIDKKRNIIFSYRGSSSDFEDSNDNGFTSNTLNPVFRPSIRRGRHFQSVDDYVDVSPYEFYSDVEGSIGQITHFANSRKKITRENDTESVTEISNYIHALLLSKYVMYFVSTFEMPINCYTLELSEKLNPSNHAKQYLTEFSDICLDIKKSFCLKFDHYFRNRKTDFYDLKLRFCNVERTQSEESIDSTGKKKSFKRLCVRFAEKTSMQGVPYIHAARLAISKVVWTILFIIAIGIMVAHLVYLSAQFFSWPKITKLTLEFSKLELPEMTI
ncbi:hypothetical protein KUTeg_017114, partial [Tegillarca granosa]